MSKILYEEIESAKKFTAIAEIPNYITENLKHSFYFWQKEAFENFLIYEQGKEKNNNKSATHLMFNMATGSGKTLLMASLILYYYKKGYRYFLFFVNQNNIVDKTENNFIDNTHNKYLFKETITIDNKSVSIEKVDMFSDNPVGIEIKFTTIQKLHNDIHNIKENINNFEDLLKRNIIMLADEAHHLNSKTIKKPQYEIAFNEIVSSKISDIEKAWESTVVNLLQKNHKEKKSVSKNVLLEFTATISDNLNVIEKYRDKIIYKFDLINFLRAGYTKEVNLISSTLNKKERILHALLFNWYRHKIALENDIANFKPIILFRSKSIKESEDDYKYFLDIVSNISKKDFTFLKVIKDKIQKNITPNMYEQGLSKTEKLLNYIREKKIDYSEIVSFIKNNFEDKNIVITNSKTNTATTVEKTDDFMDNLLNNLEDKKNIIRAIFTVKRLTEGWDVLNLFDIVRLSEGQNTGGSTKGAAKSTIEERQLIGRGIRYYPFKYKDKDYKKRKFDNDYNNESGLRILEELNYYTYDEESRYISELKKELRKEGIIDDNKEVKTFAIKEDFKKTDFYKKTILLYNKKIENPNKKKNDFSDIKEYYKNNPLQYNCGNLNISETNVKTDEKNEMSEDRKINRQFNINNFNNKYNKHIFYKAIHILSCSDKSILQFNNIKQYLNIKTIDNLLEDKFLGDIPMYLLGSGIDFEKILEEDKLNALILFLEQIFNTFKEGISDNIGTDLKEQKKLKDFFDTPKEKVIDKKKDFFDVSKEDWFILDTFIGTDQEISLFDFIKRAITELKKKYKEIYLLRNEEVYKIYNFKDGRGFAPDFLLFLKSERVCYEVFIEAKGEQLLEYDKWKNDFLHEISKKYKNVISIENTDYRLMALPLYNKDNTELNYEEFNNFNKEFDKL